MKLSRRRLNRTLLHRQHLLERTGATPDEMAQHLVGLQAQENLPPYLSLAARLEDFDPYDVTRGLEERTLVRLLAMRGTIHLLTPEDALTLRPVDPPVHDREIRISQNVGGARDVDRDAFGAALSELLADGPLPQKASARPWPSASPTYPATQLGQLARSAAPLVQLPPRGTWKGSGGVVYQHVDRWVGRPSPSPTSRTSCGATCGRSARPRPPTSTAWSAVTRLGPVLKGMDDLATHEDENGKVLYDVPDGELADEDTPAPVRLLGAYDNVWLSHAGRDRVTDPETRTALDGRNGASAYRSSSTAGSRPVAGRRTAGSRSCRRCGR